MDTKLVLDSTPISIALVARRPALSCKVDECIYTVEEIANATDGRVILTIDGEAFHVWRALEGDRVHLKLGTRTFSVTVEDALNAAAHQGETTNALKADMPGVVVAVNCRAGDAVRAGDPLLTLESMKMQMTLAAPRDGTIETIKVDVNDNFQKGAVLVILAAEAEATPA